jgi:hypothetical protein
MKKIKEVRLPVGAGQPDYPGTSNKVFIGYNGGMLTNADSSASRRMQVVNNSYDIEEESTDEESEEDMILNERKKINGKFSLLETLTNIEVASEESEVDEAEAFEEIDLAEFSGAGGAGGYVTPLGGNPNKPPTKKAQTAHHKLFEKEKAINEQRKRIALLQKYHERTTNKLK